MFDSHRFTITTYRQLERILCAAQLLLMECMEHEWDQTSTLCVCVQHIPIHSLYATFSDSFHVPFHLYQCVCSGALKHSKTVGAPAQVGANRSVATLLAVRVSSLALTADARCASHGLVFRDRQVCLKTSIERTNSVGLLDQVWTREAGIQATATVEGYQCFRYVECLYV